MKIKNVLFLAVAVGALSAEASDSIWGNWIAGGTSCGTNNVQTVVNGDSLSVLFDEFGVNMPQGAKGDGTTARKTCTFRITMTPPSGFYLARFRQVYSGGLIKSANSSAQLNIRYNVGSVVGRALPIIWENGTTVSPEDPESIFSRTYQNNLLVANCGESTVYGINMSFTAVRGNPFSDFLVGGLDSVDAQFIQRVVLVPEWEMCPAGEP